MIVKTMRATSAPGIFGMNCLQRRMTTMEPMPTAIDHQLMSGIALTNCHISRNQPSASTETPIIFSIWLLRTSMPSPVTKPIITARDRKFARNPSRKIQKAKKTTPHINAWANASCR